MTGLSVIVPTYNERSNVSQVIREIDKRLAETVDRYEILVVDDDSPDGTWRRAQALADDHVVRVVRRTDERGLATAVVRGFAEAAYDVYCVIDGDLQHPPHRILDLWETYQRHSATDIVIGSRTAEGGSFGPMGFRGRVRSRIAAAIAWVVLPETRNVGDVQSGFFLVDGQAIENATLDPRGYKILLEILVTGQYDDVREVGYTFQPRGGEESNYRLKTALEYLLHVSELWSRTRRKPGF